MGKELVKKDLKIKSMVLVAENRMTEMIKNLQLHIPPDFSAPNALRSAQLEIEGDVNLASCEPESIQKALLKMITLGLSPSKQQIYFIPRQGKLIAQTSYFGDMALVKRYCGALEISNMAIHKGDSYSVKVVDGRYQVEHTPLIPNPNPEVVAAYTTIIFPEFSTTTFMDIHRIKKAWSFKSNLYKEKGTGVHHEFEDEMAKRTVCRAACKGFLRASADITEMERQIAQAELDNKVANSKKTVIDFNEPEKLQKRQEAAIEIESFNEPAAPEPEKICEKSHNSETEEKQVQVEQVKKASGDDDFFDNL